MESNGVLMSLKTTSFKSSNDWANKILRKHSRSKSFFSCGCNKGFLSFLWWASSTSLAVNATEFNDEVRLPSNEFLYRLKNEKYQNDCY